MKKIFYFIGKFKFSFKRYYFKVVHIFLFFSVSEFFRRKKLKNKNFSIISNNCWGGFVYRYFGLEYKSPFIDLFLFPDCYLKLLENFEFFMCSSLNFIDIQDSKYYLHLLKINKVNHPVGLLGKDIEIHFLHYASPKDALKKWNRRKARINYDNLLIKFSEEVFCTPSLIRRFDQLPFKYKFCFCVNNYKYDSTIKCPAHIFDSWKNEWKISQKLLKLHLLLNKINH